MVALCAMGIAAWAAEPAVEEVDVYGARGAHTAREAVVAQLAEQGFIKERRRDDRVVLLHRDNWRGKAVLYDDGRVAFRRQGPKGTMPDTIFSQTSPAIGWVPCIVVPTACVKVGGWVVSARKRDPVERRAMATIGAGVSDWHERIADEAVEQKVKALAVALDDCWRNGQPLTGDEALPDAASRVEHLVAFANSRTRTVWGDRVRDVVRAYLYDVAGVTLEPR